MMSKEFTTYQQQINFLITEKNLTITNQEEAISILKKESYFSLINGYKGLFKQENNKSLYINGATFMDIYALYKFDESIRIIFLKYILIVERHIKSLISYEFCAKNGEKQCEYYNATNYRYNSENAEEINKFLGVLSGIYKRAKEHQYIEHYNKNYKNIPLWVLMNVLTFGQVSLMYQYLTDSMQSAVAKNFYGLRQNELVSMLHVITYFRNVCAHNERLFNFTVSKYSVPKTYIHSYMGCVAHEGKQDLFSIVICFKYLLDNQDFKAFIAEFQGALDKYKCESNTLTKKDLLKHMGFHQNWYNILKAPKVKPANVHTKQMTASIT